MRIKRREFIMLIKGRDLIGKPIIHTDTSKPEIEPVVHDLLLNEATLNVISLILNEKTPIKNEGEPNLETEMHDVVFAAGASYGMGPISNTPMITETDIHHDDLMEQTYYVDVNKIIDINATVLKMVSNEREAHDPDNTFAFTKLQELHVQTEQGQHLGKITDIVIDWDKKQMVGVELYEGFWASIVSDGVKYMGIEAPILVRENKLIVPNRKEHELTDDYEELPK
jgi:uncharacterized protein YrrD